MCSSSTRLHGALHLHDPLMLNSWVSLQDATVVRNPCFLSRPEDQPNSINTPLMTVVFSDAKGGFLDMLSCFYE